MQAELVRKGPWRSIDDLEIAVGGYFDWFDHRRLRGETSRVPPAEWETEHCRRHHAPAAIAPYDGPSRLTTDGSTRRRPAWAEVIPAAAQLCRSCGTALPSGAH